MKKLAAAVLSAGAISLAIVCGVSTPAMAAKVPKVTPIQVTSAVDTGQGFEKYVVNVKMNAKGEIVKDKCKLTSSEPRNKTKFECVSVSAITQDGNTVSIDAAVQVTEADGRDSGVQNVRLVIQDNANPGAGADTFSLIFLPDGPGYETVIERGDFLIEN